MNESKYIKTDESIYEAELPVEGNQNVQEEDIAEKRKRLLQEWLNRAKDIKKAHENEELQKKKDIEVKQTDLKNLRGRFVEKERSEQLEEIIDDAEFKIQEFGNMRFMSLKDEIKRTTVEKPRMEMKITVSNDKMSANILFYNKKNEDVRNCTELEINNELAKQGIVFGIDPRMIRLAAEYPVYGQEITIARGLKPTRGKDGHLDWVVREHKEYKPKLLDNGTVDYRLLGYTTSVQKGTVLCELVEPEAGAPGTDIYGRTVPPLVGTKANVELGNNVEMIGNQIVSKCGGIFKTEGNTISVYDKFTVPNGVNYGTGNIETSGSFIIMDSVSPGFTVKADGDISIEGTVENATIIAGGSINISMGATGRKTVIIAGDEVNLNFAENVTIKAGGTVNVNSIINSYVTCGGDINFRDKKPALVAGITTVRGNINAVDVGTKSNAKTVISFKKHGLHSKKMNDLLKEKEKMEGLAKRLEVIIESFNKMSPIIARNMKPEQIRYYENINRNFVEINKRLNEVNKEIEDTAEDERKKGQYISSSGTIYAGTVLETDKEEFVVTRDMRMAVFVCKDDVISKE